jgi:hypothetical protein
VAGMSHSSALLMPSGPSVQLRGCQAARRLLRHGEQKPLLRLSHAFWHMVAREAATDGGGSPMNIAQPRVLGTTPVQGEEPGCESLRLQ